MAPGPSAWVTMKQLKTFDQAPKPVQEELNEILKEAKGKQ